MNFTSGILGINKEVSMVSFPQKQNKKSTGDFGWYKNSRIIESIFEWKLSSVFSLYHILTINKIIEIKKLKE